MERIGDLDINEDIAFQEREWTAERLGWVALFLVVTLALLGLFGNGPISWTSATTDDGSLEVSFERFGRRGGGETLTVRADASAASDGAWQVQIGRDYLGAVRVEAVTPEPDSVETIAGAVRYTFLQAEDGADLELELSLTPTTLWGASGEIGLAGADTVTVRHFFFP